jgi:hypothetical protein
MGDSFALRGADGALQLAYEFLTQWRRGGPAQIKARFFRFPVFGLLRNCRLPRFS